MDLTETIVPNSDQLNADDLMTGPRTFTIDKVSAGSTEQPVDVHLVEFPGRPYRPSKSMRRVMVAAWGKEASTYVGHRLTLFRDPEVTFGRDKVGGIKISHLSNIDRQFTVALTATRGKRAPFMVKPLPDVATHEVVTPAQPEPTHDQVASCTDPTELRNWWKVSGPRRRSQIEARVEELTQPPTTPDGDDDRSDELAAVHGGQS